MLRVKFSTSLPDRQTVLRQTPGRSGIWGDCQFLVDQPVEECDAWVVFEELGAAESTRCPRGSTIFITGEPPDYRSYTSSFVNQFAAVITCQHGMRHPNAQPRQLLPWHAGIDRHRSDAVTQDYDSLQAMGCCPKSKLLSVICSDKRATEGHRLRRNFVARLKARFGDRLDVFGRGHRPVGDKWDAIAGYRYHLAIENSRLEHYWTEKLADAYLAWSYPIYYGCPNLDHYFSRDAYTPIDIRDFESAVRSIEAVIEEDLFSRRQAQIQAARDQVLNRYNLFSVLARFVKSLPQDGRKKRQTIFPEPCFRRPSRYQRWVQKVRKHLPGRVFSKPRFWKDAATRTRGDASQFPFFAVLGLHSSGSSCLAGVCHHLGAHLGNRLTGYYGSNPNENCGFEAHGLVSLCEESIPFPKCGYALSRQEITRRLQRWINRRKSEGIKRGQPTAGKYPQLCRMGEMLNNACGNLLRVIVSDRPLEESIASLCKRQGATPEDPRPMHNTYSLEAHQRWLEEGKEELIASLPAEYVLRVPYGELLTNPEQWVDKLTEFLGLKPLPKQRERALAWVDPSQRHVGI